MQILLKLHPDKETLTQVNAARLVSLMGGELDVEDEVDKKPEQEKEPDKILEKKKMDFYLNSLMILSQKKSR